MKLIKAARFFRINNSADNIFAVADLSVVVAKLSQDIAGYKINQLRIYGCCADIHGNGIVPIGGIPGLNIYDIRLSTGLHRSGERGRYFEIALS